MVEVDAHSFRGVGPLRNEKPRIGGPGIAWGVDGGDDWPTLWDPRPQPSTEP